MKKTLFPNLENEESASSSHAEGTSSIILGDVRKRVADIANIADSEIRTCVTSPPYWGLRDYGFEDQIGQESHPDEFVESMVEAFKGVKDILADDGTLWLNIGDTYVGTGHKGEWTDPKNPQGRNGQSVALNNKVEGLKQKDMIGVPWKVAFALQQDGWFLRSDIIWHKPNQMPSPVKDRPVSSYEHVFLLSKSKKYHYDYESVQEDTSTGKKRRQRDVWSIHTKPFSEAHFAVFPKELVIPCVLAGSKEGDTIIDPFSGSGTTGIVALEQGRNYVGVESSSKYADMSVNRIKEETGIDSLIR